METSARGARGWKVLAVGSVVLAPLTLTACAGPRCSSRGPSETIIGRVTARTKSTATFSVESVPLPPDRSPANTVSSVPPPVLTPGQTVTVRYFEDHAKFLRIGTRYRVNLYWHGSGPFESNVHTSDVPCSGGTVYADGSAINTASWTRSHLLEIVLLSALAPIALAVMVLIIARTTMRTLRRRAALPK